MVLYQRMKIDLIQRPSWSRTFIEEPKEQRHDGIETRRQPLLHTILLCAVAITSLCLQLCLLLTPVPKLWIVFPATGLGLISIYFAAIRPRRFSLIPLALFVVVWVAQCIFLIKTWRESFRLEQHLITGSVVSCLIGIIVTINMPMRDPRWSRSDISKPFSEPTDKYRSPEDNLTFWQWMTVSWVAPMLKRARMRQLNEDDVWQLPYEFQHTHLHNKFRQLNGSVFRRIMVANWIDLVILTLLELGELITNYAEPVLLQGLLKAFEKISYDKRPALTYALLILLARVVNAQSEVFSLWYARRCYERSRGELITMIYEKTLHRKVVAQTRTEKDDQEGPVDDSDLDRVPTTRSNDESTPLLAKSTQSDQTQLQKAWRQLRTLWTNFRIGAKGLDVKKQEPAALGKILNLMKNDAYEVAQRWWEIQDLVGKPLGVVTALGLIWRLLGWPAFVGVAVVVVAQILNYLLALVNIRFEKVRRAATDKRLQQTSQYVESIRHLRWYGWQNHWLKNVFKARQKELNMKVVAYIWNQIIVFNNVFSSGSILVAAFWAYTILAKRQLSVDIIFPALEIFGMVEDTMEEIPELIQAFLNANVALKRIQAFMDEPMKQELTQGFDVSETQVMLQGASFAWPGLEVDVLHDLDLTLAPGVTIVVGEVASGKTALLLAILGELDMSSGDLKRPLSPIAYCAQTPWLQSMTIRDNILFNAPYHPERYKKALQVCALLPDLASFEKGDLSAIGENGIGLSGGQKARVGLARAVYSDAAILLLDDPLSALDQQTAEYIVAECFQGDLLKGRTVVLVTHRTDLCAPICHQIVTMSHGRATSREHDASVSEQASMLPNGSTNGHANPSAKDSKTLEDALPDKFEDEEHREHGDIKGRVYWIYLKAGSLTAWASIALTITLLRLVGVALNWYLKEFGEAYNEPNAEYPALSSSRNYVYAHYGTASAALPSFLGRFFDKFPAPQNNVSPWLIGLLCISLAQALSIVLSHSAILTARYLSGKNMFKAVMRRISNTTFRYYDVTPVGRLMNRLTSDINQVDSGVGADLYMILYYSITWVVSIVVIASITPLFLLVSALVTIVFVWIFLKFLPTSQSLRRLETVSLSPLMTNFGALLAGLTTVRAFKAEDRFQAKLIKVVDNFQAMDHFYWSVQSWLSYRLEIVSAVSAFGLTLIAIYNGLSAGLTAFALVSAQKFVQTTHGLCRVYGRLQVNFVSVERVVELLDLEQEPTNAVPPPAWWPSFGGSIIFDHVTLRYAPHLEPALIDISFELQGGSNTAIVGRTGSGKSTLAAALLATVPADQGRILVDGVDLATVDRQALRSRITFLAQEPVLFDGSLRHNLDPIKEHSDADCENVIKRVAGRFEWTLDMNIETGGKNLSQGQRQLVGLARAILRRSSIIIMDEATASIDVDTAWEIQRVLREELKGSTVITIAHRTAAVRDADNAITLSEGRLVSFGPAASSSIDTEGNVSA